MAPKKRRSKTVTIDLGPDEYESLSPSPPIRPLSPDLEAAGIGKAYRAAGKAGSKALALAGKAGSAGVGLALQGASAVGESFISAMKNPIYSNIRTEHWVEKGREITRTRGGTVPLGLPVGILAALAVWEAANYIGQGLAKAAGIVTPIAEIMSPITWPIAAAEYLGPVYLQDVQNLETWLGTNRGSSIGAATPPPVASTGTTATIYTKPPTAMASLANFTGSVLDPLAAALNFIGPQMVTGLSSAPPSSQTGGGGSLPTPSGGSCPVGSTLMNGPYPSKVQICVPNNQVSFFQAGGWTTVSVSQALNCPTGSVAMNPPAADFGLVQPKCVANQDVPVYVALGWSKAP